MDMPSNGNCKGSPLLEWLISQTLEGSSLFLGSDKLPIDPCTHLYDICTLLNGLPCWGCKPQVCFETSISHNVFWKQSTLKLGFMRSHTAYERTQKLHYPCYASLYWKNGDLVVRALGRPGPDILLTDFGNLNLFP
ncbi:hypothetical protein TNCV_771131 [Trichonephila clavipes]|nr:hypothetical protein TNCV_771131 [Trichonephila clavipes]